jgi:hypothetical protein
MKCLLIISTPHETSCHIQSLSILFLIADDKLIVVPENSMYTEDQIIGRGNPEAGGLRHFYWQKSKSIYTQIAMAVKDG